MRDEGIRGNVSNQWWGKIQPSWERNVEGSVKGGGRGLSERGEGERRRNVRGEGEESVVRNDLTELERRKMTVRSEGHIGDGGG